MIRPLGAPLAALLLALALAACGSRDVERETAAAAPSSTSTSTPTDPTPVPANATRPPAATTPEGTRQAGPSPTATVPPLPEALQTMLADVAEVRQLEVPPALRALTIPRADLPALLDRLTSDDEREDYAKLTTLYRLLGHLGQDQDYGAIFDEFGAEAILGLYSPNEDTLWVVTESADEGFEDLSRGELETLAHELVHALQDYHFALDETFDLVAGNLDREQAWTAVVEGDAVTHEGRYSQRFLWRPGVGRAFLLGGLPQIGNVPISIVRELLFPYTTGAAWIRDVLADEGIEAIDALIVDPPAATSLILHPELRAAGWQPEQVVLPRIEAALGPGWERESGGTLGEFHLQNYLRLQTGSGTANRAAEGWSGDRYDVYTDGERSVIVARLRFVDEEETAEFAETHRDLTVAAAGMVIEAGALTLAAQSNGNVVALLEPRGRDVFFAIGSDAEAAEAALGAILGG